MYCKPRSAHAGDLAVATFSAGDPRFLQPTFDELRSPRALALTVTTSIQYSITFVDDETDTAALRL